MAVEAQRRLRAVALEFVENPTAENRAEMDAIASDMAALASRVDDELTQFADGASAQDYDLKELTVHQLQMLTHNLPEEDQYRCTSRLCAEFRAALKAYLAAPAKTVAEMKLAYGKLGGIETQTKHLSEMRRIADERNASQFLTSKTLEAAFEGRIAVTTLVETRLNGLPDEDGTIVVDVSKIKARVLLHCVAKATGSHSVRLPDHIDGELYDRLVAMEGGKARDDYIADLRARLSEDQVEVAILRLDGAIRHAKALKERNCVVSAADWEKHDVQRKVAGRPPAPLPSYNGFNKASAEFASKAQTTLRRTVCPFRRDLLAAIAKPGWFN